MSAVAGNSLYSDEVPERLASVTVPEGGYRSPLMSRLGGVGKLTLEGLQADVPLLRAGRDAEAQLAANPGLSTVERQALLRSVRAGEAAKERLVLAGLPLIKSLAQREHRRRQGWQSQVTFEELVQEGISGLLRGLNAYKVDGAQKSPTNYLGQWIMTEMRRNVEELEHDFGVPFDAVERHRRIRAIRNRLNTELGREPTDEEIIAASSQAYSAYGDAKIGRVGSKPATGKVITAAQIAEERELRARVGAADRLAAASDDTGTWQEDRAKALDGTPGTGHDAEVVDRDAKDALGRVLGATFDYMQLPSVQRDVIARRFGLPPHPEEQSSRDISRVMNLNRAKVGEIIEAFQQEMARPGGGFHQVTARMDPAELADIGLGWVTSTLGPLTGAPAPREATTAGVLTEPLQARTSTLPPPPSLPGASDGVHVQFMCPYHGSTFVGRYKKPEDVPPTRDCPRCARPSQVIRVLER